MRFSIASALAVAASLAAGCASSNKVDIGEGHEPPPAVLGETLTDYAGVWDGYAEAWQWNDGSDHVELTLDAQGMGSFAVGEAAPLPAPDPAHGYPDPNDEEPKLVTEDLAPIFLSGFDYPVHGANVDAKRIRFTTSSNELFREWCEAQPSYLDVGAWPARYACVTGFGYGGSPAMCTAYNGRNSQDASLAMTVDCGQAATCIAHCLCDETSCGPVGGGMDNAMVDAALEDDGASLVGTLVLGAGRVTVRMTRM